MQNTMGNTQSNQGHKVPVWVIVLAWVWVGVPLAWGVMQTVQKAADLFK